jgi:BON domain/Pentapeptide repeats (8 copies)
MADRYEDRERSGGRWEDRGNAERNREEFDREHRHSGGYEDRRDEFGRNRENFGRENYGRENYGRENYGRENFGRENQGRENFGREDYGRQNYGRENSGRDDWRREPERGDYNPRGDWGRQGSWGTYGNRPDYSREAEWRDYGRRGESEWGGFNTGRTNLYGTGGGGFGSGFSSYGAGSGSYSGGMGSYSGGIGSYGERGERGRFTGRGPKNWQRSDDRIREDVNERLTDHPEIDASEIDVQVKNGEVTLTGTVDERRVKRLAEDVTENVSGVREVHNQLKVQQSQSMGQEQGGRSNAGISSGSTTAKRS